MDPILSALVSNPVVQDVAKDSLKFLGSQVLDAIRATGENALREAWNQMMEEMLLEVAGAFPRLKADVQAVQNEVARLHQDKVDVRGFMIVLQEGRRTLSNERLSLLASAFVGLFNPDLDKDLKTRVFRIALSLEPSDVVALRDYRALGLSRLPLPLGPKTDRIPDLNAMVQERRLSFFALESTGCVVPCTEAITQTYPLPDYLADQLYRTAGLLLVTKIGAGVLDLLSTFESRQESPSRDAG